jgi:hypothetical protein
MNYFNQPFKNWNRIINYSLEYKQTSQAKFGDLNSLMTDELINLCNDKKHIIVYGHTKSGKVIIAKKLSEILKRQLIISDDYMHLGFENSMYHIRDMIKEIKEPLIIEGVQTPRILRKGIENSDFFCDLIIHLTINENSITMAYHKDKESEKLKNNKVFNFNKNVLDKIFFEWYSMQKSKHPEKMPVIVNVNTSFINY